MCAATMAKVDSAADINLPTSRVQIVDASVLSGIGPDHHSFRMMAAAFQRAQASAGIG